MYNIRRHGKPGKQKEICIFAISLTRVFCLGLHSKVWESITFSIQRLIDLEMEIWNLKLLTKSLFVRCYVKNWYYVHLVLNCNLFAQGTDTFKVFYNLQLWILHNTTYLISYIKGKTIDLALRIWVHHSAGSCFFCNNAQLWMFCVLVDKLLGVKISTYQEITHVPKMSGCQNLHVIKYAYRKAHRNYFEKSHESLIMNQRKLTNNPLFLREIKIFKLPASRFIKTENWIPQSPLMRTLIQYSRRAVV